MRQRIVGLVVGLVGGLALITAVTGCGVTFYTAKTTLAISTKSPLTTTSIDLQYAFTFTATGGFAPYTWSLVGGSLPPGLTLSSTGVLSGTPTTPGTYAITVKATDAEHSPQTATLTAALVIDPAHLVITTGSPLTTATVNNAYTATFAASGGTPPYSWSLAGGSLPDGLALSSAGILSGTPGAAGSYSFTLRVTDSESTPQTATADFSLQVSVGPLSVTTTSLPAGNVGTAYVAQLAASGGAPPYVWSVTAGSLPPGILLSATGFLSGTPGSATSLSPTFTVTDTAGHSASASLALTIHAATGTVPDNYYSFVFAGTAPQGTPLATNGIAINGIIKIESGMVVGGFYDENFNTSSPVLKAPISAGTLVLGADGLGQLVLATGSDTMTFALASPSSVSTGGLTPIRMIEYDDSTGGGSRGSGVIDPTPPNPTTGAISGNFAFLFSGTDLDQNQQALIGAFQTDGAGNITGGNADANQVVPVGGVSTREVANLGALSGSYSVDGDGRGLLILTLGGTSFHFSFYEVSPQEWLVISLDPATLNSPLVSGMVYQQTGGPFSVSSLPPVSVVEASGVKPASVVGIPPTPDILLGLATSNGSGTMTYTFDDYDGAFTSGNTLSVVYSVDPITGRTTATAGESTGPLLYLISSTSAFYLGVSASGQSGMIEAQSGQPFNNASFSGNYLGGSFPLALTSVLNESGLVTADGTDRISFTTNRSNSSGLAYQNDIVGTYQVGSTGRAAITASDGLIRIIYLVSPTKAAYLTNDGGGYLGSFEQ